MQNVLKVLFIVFLTFAFGEQALAESVLQERIVDTVPKKSADTTKKKERKPQAIAARRSAIIPGWGQIYNKKYWKLPIVYGALAIPVITFTYNKGWYDKTREAYTIRVTEDTARYDEIDEQLKPLSTGSLKMYRDEFRQNMDFSVLAFILLWGLQVADAAVDAHLKGFNVTDDLSMKVKPWISPGTKTNGVSLVFNFRDGKTRTVLPSY
jgi:hypothetical protein